MGLFEHFPYTNFHELNLGWFLTEFRHLLEEWGAFHENVEQFMQDIEDAWIEQQGKFDDINDAWEAMKLWIQDYFENLDLQQEVNNYFNELLLQGLLPQEIAQYLANYATPEMYGAIGDGITDDTQAIADMFADGAGAYLFRNTYAISDNVNVSGYIFGDGTIKALNNMRIATGYFLPVGECEITGITFDTQCDVPFIAADYGDLYNCAVYAENYHDDLYIHDCKFINGYNCFIYEHICSGNLKIRNNEFYATLATNQYTGFMIYLLTLNGSHPVFISDNSFVGNGDSVANFGGIFLSGITDREKVVINNNFFDNVGRNKTGGHQAFCVDGYWNVSHVKVFDNTFVNNTYCVIRIHGADDWDVHDNFIGDPTVLITDSAVLVQDDQSSTGLTQVGVSHINIHDNVFNNTHRYGSAVQATSQNSSNAGSITNLHIVNNTIDGSYATTFTFDGSVKGVNIEGNLIKNTNGGIYFTAGSAAYTFSAGPLFVITRNFIEVKGGSAIGSDANIGDIYLRVTLNYFHTYGYALTMGTQTQNTLFTNNMVEGSSGVNNVYRVGCNNFALSNPSQAVVNAYSSYGNYLNYQALP